MSRPIEDRVRDLMADRTATVAPPAGWEERIVSAGRRRRTRRRIGAAAGAVVAAVLVFVVVSSGLPRALLGIEPVKRPGVGSRPPVDPGDLPEGEPTRHLYATSKGDNAAKIVFGKETLNASGFVSQLVSTPNGFVASVTGEQNRLIYRRVGESERLIRSSLYGSSFAVSPDGTRIAWLNPAGENDRKHGDLRLAELPSGRIIRTLPVQLSAPPRLGTPFVTGFLGDRVVLTYEGPGTPPYAWVPEAGRIEPLLGPDYRVRTQALLDLRSDAVLLLDSEGCMRNVRPSEPRPVERWKVCGFEQTSTVARMSPDGRWLAGHGLEGDTIWVRDLTTGRLTWQQKLRMGVHFGDSIADRRVVTGLRLTQLAWESANQLLVMYGSPADLDRELGDLLRCDVEVPACERVPTTTGERVTRLGE